QRQQAVVLPRHGGVDVSPGAGDVTIEPQLFALLARDAYGPAVELMDVLADPCQFAKDRRGVRSISAFRNAAGPYGRSSPLVQSNYRVLRPTWSADEVVPIDQRKVAKTP